MPEKQSKAPTPAKPGTTEEKPRWEGPEATRPRGYKPSRDDPDADRDAAGESNRAPARKSVRDALRIRED